MAVHLNLDSNTLIEHAKQTLGAQVSANGALCVTTGKRTGRSPKDRYIVQTEDTIDTVSWGPVNRPMNEQRFHALWQRAEAHCAEKDCYRGHYQVGADRQLGVPVTVTTEWAWHQLFCYNLFIRPTPEQQSTAPGWTLLNASTMLCDPERDGTHSDGAVCIHLGERKVLLCGMHYAGEMKKAMFSALNYILPEHNVLPMHCAANQNEAGSVSLFFGLSGTGKTTLSADPDRLLIGDDEHGWGPEGVFNFEGGCYAKCIDLSVEREPVIWNAIKHGAIMENVVLDDRGQPDFKDSSLTQNTRVAYPREHIDKRVASNAGDTPQSVIFLTCDLHGVLPPVAILSRSQAAYYFLSGYTALVGSTEMGSSAGIRATFSTCFGAPFFPRSAAVYADLLTKRLEESDCPVYLVNTGWTGGGISNGGQRFSIPTTRQIIRSIQDGSIQHANTTVLPGFNLTIPTSLPGVANHCLDPRQAWAVAAESPDHPLDPSQVIQSYQHQSLQLRQAFIDNFTKFADVADSIRSSGPTLDAA